MNLTKKAFSLLLIVLTINLYFPKINFAQEFRFHSKANVKTPFTGVQSTLDSETQPLPEPEIRSTPEKDLPSEKISKWMYVLIVVLAIAGIGAAAGGGGGGGGGDDGGSSTTPTSDTGDISVTW